MKRLTLTSLLLLAILGSSFAQAPPTSGRPSVQAKSKQSAGCKFVGTVRGTKLWVGDCMAADQLRSGGAPAAESNLPSLQEQAAGAVPAGQK